MRSFSLAYPILDSLRREWSWTHYRTLLKIDKPDARGFYENETVNARWSTRELDRQVNSLLFERLALSSDKAGLKKLANCGHEIAQPIVLVKDPYVLEFTGLRPTTSLRETDLEQALIDKIQQFLLELGKAKIHRSGSFFARTKTKRSSTTRSPKATRRFSHRSTNCTFPPCSKTRVLIVAWGVRVLANASRSAPLI